MSVLVVLGTQWGDEGKGKIVDLLSEKIDIVARTAGGSNAGHTIYVDGHRYAFHLLPCGVLYPNVKCLIGNGVVIHIPSYFEELNEIESAGVKCSDRVFLSDRAHLLFDFHQLIDSANEKIRGASKIGTTQKGIGPCYTTKTERIGLRVGDLLNFEQGFIPRFNALVDNISKKFPSLTIDKEKEISRYREYALLLKDSIIDGVYFINEAIQQGKKVMIEGANAVMLDLDLGTYPYVTSSYPSIGGCITGIGISSKKIGEIIGIVKAYTTRVGAGPFPTELDTSQKGSVGEHLLQVGREFGTTTGRARRCGWLDLVQLKYSVMVNGYTKLAMTKVDILTGIDEIRVSIGYTYQGKPVVSFPSDLVILEGIEVQYKVFPGWKTSITEMRSYSDLPVEARNYIEFIQSELGVPFTYFGVGPSRESAIVKK